MWWEKERRSVGAIEDPNKLFYNSKASDKFPEKIEWIDYSQLDWFDSHIVLDGIKGTDGLQIKGGDELYNRDIVIMQNMYLDGGSPYIYTTAGTEYWVASRYVSAGSYDARFTVRCVTSHGVDNTYALWYTKSNGSAISDPHESAVRPVIKITLESTNSFLFI